MNEELYANIISQILPLIRGKKAQLHISLQLGYKQNQVYRWESGQRDLSWTSFVEYCRLCNINLAPCLNKYFSYSDDILDMKLFCKKMIGHMTIAETTRLTGINRKMISKWFKGTSKPSLREMFTIIDQCHNVLGLFLSEFVDVSSIPGLATSSSPANPGTDLLKHGLHTLLQFSGPESPENLAKEASLLYLIPAEEFLAVISDLISKNTLKLENNLLSINEDLTAKKNDRIASIESNKFWLAQAMKRLDHIDDYRVFNRFHYLMFSFNEEDDQKVKELSRQCLKKLSDLSQKSRNSDSVLRSISISDIKIC